MLPIIPFFFGSGYSALAIAVGISVTASFIVGAVKSRMAQTGIVKGGLENGWTWNWSCVNWVWYW